MKNPAIKYFEKATGYSETQLEFFFSIFPKFQEEFAWMDDATKISEFRRRNNVNVYSIPTGAMLAFGKETYIFPLKISLCVLNKNGYANLKLVKFLMEYHSFSANDALYYLFIDRKDVSRKSFECVMSSQYSMDELIKAQGVKIENSRHESLRWKRSNFLNTGIDYKDAYSRVEALNQLVVRNAHRLQNDFDTILRDIDKEIRSI